MFMLFFYKIFIVQFDFRKNKSLIFSRKKFKVTIENQTEWLSKDDFISQKSWEKFIHFVKATRTHKDTILHGMGRMKKQKNTIKNLLKTLQEKELLSNQGEKMLKVNLNYLH